MGRTIKRILIGSGVAVALFLGTIFLFGDQNTISLNSLSLSAQKTTGQGEVIGGGANLTEQLTEKIATQIILDNPDGAKDGKMLIPEALAAETSGLQPENFIESIDETRVSVLPTNNLENSKIYIQSLLSILKNNFKTALAKTEDQEAVFEVMARERTAALEELYALKVTPDLAELHRDFLTLVGTQRNIFTALSHYTSDPLRAMVAIELEPDIEVGLKDIVARFTEYINVNGLAE